MNHWNIKMFRKWGTLTGKMSKKLPIPAHTHRLSFGQLSNKLYQRLENISLTIAENYQNLCLDIMNLKMNANSYGHIHNDLHHGNMMIEDHELIVVDTNGCAYSWYTNDLAVALYHANWYGKSVNPSWGTLLKRFSEKLFRRVHS
jgi:Ser/Thr protein kinase RdoA (MazF antagonist)